MKYNLELFLICLFLTSNLLLYGIKHQEMWNKLYPISLMQNIYTNYKDSRILELAKVRS